MDHNLYTHLLGQFPADRNACALEVPARGTGEKGFYYTWGDLERGSARIANFFASLNLPVGSRVVVQVEKSPEAVMLYLAVLRAGLVFVPLNSGYQAQEVDYFIGNAKPALLVVSPSNIERLTPIAQAHSIEHCYSLGEDRDGTLLSNAVTHADQHQIVERKSTDLGAILYTSGTTGRSKGAMLTHDNLLSNALVLKKFWGWKRADVLLHALPIFHVHGLFVALHGALISGSKMLWLNKFEASHVVSLLPRATVFMGVPTMYVRLLDHAEFDRRACRNMRLFVSGSAPLLTETFNSFEQRTGRRILERYGMSETIMLTSNPYNGERVAGTVGITLPGLDLRIADDNDRAISQGEIGGIQVKGLSVFSGYWEMPEKTALEFTGDGFFRTGDVGRMDERGYISIVGRSKDLIISGGYNVYPKEIEALLDEYYGVQESAVFGIAHRDFGEAVTAVVVLKPGAVFDEAKAIAWMRERVASFKAPKRIYVLNELPRNTMGKVQKNLLRDQFA